MKNNRIGGVSSLQTQELDQGPGRNGADLGREKELAFLL